MKFSIREIETWLVRSFRATSVSKSEFQFNCPRCSEEKFFFNPFKLKGHCKRASCAYIPTFQELIDLVGSSPDGSGYYVPPTSNAPVLETSIVLPEKINPIVYLEKGKYLTSSQETLDYLCKDRNLTIQDIYKFKLMCDIFNIYIPVYEDGKLISYLNRSKWWKFNPREPKYLYPKGGRHSETIFNWDQVKYWDNLVLVENTFNAIWLQNLKVSTNFGSSLSDSQVCKIEQSAIRKCVIMWDAGSEKKAEKARSKLRKAGKDVVIVQISGQPDGYNLVLLETMIKDSLNAKPGTVFLDRRMATS